MNIRHLVTRNGKSYRLPMFIPVYQPKSNLIAIEDLKNNFSIEGLICNGFFLYKDADVREKLESGVTVHEHIGFDGFIMTDSGAFQGLKRPLYLDNKKIVRFQDNIKADIVSPLDLISPPGDNFKTAEKKLGSTIKRIREAKELVKNGILAGVQQGGRFIELRKRSIDALMEMGVEYIAIGSLVPFFNINHSFGTIKKILKDARTIAGNDIPLHVYGAGDPVELPFLAQLGADIFDSSSYGHYGNAGWYMTIYGALPKEERHKIPELDCPCSACKSMENRSDIVLDAPTLASHNLYTILETLKRIRNAQETGTMESFLTDILDTHEKWFPKSLLKKTWLENS